MSSRNLSSNFEDGLHTHSKYKSTMKSKIFKGKNSEKLNKASYLCIDFDIKISLTSEFSKRAGNKEPC